MTILIQSEPFDILGSACTHLRLPALLLLGRNCWQRAGELTWLLVRIPFEPLLQALLLWLGWDGSGADSLISYLFLFRLRVWPGVRGTFPFIRVQWTALWESRMAWHSKEERIGEESLIAVRTVCHPQLVRSRTKPIFVWVKVTWVHVHVKIHQTRH